MTSRLADLAAKVRVCDGACGTELSRRGMAGEALPDLLNDSAPQAVERIARSYIEAGAEVILTNTLLSNRLALDRYGMADRAAGLAEAGAAIARRAACGTGVKVFGSIGPTGKVVMLSETATERIAAAFAESAEALAWGRADAIVLETFTELAELRIALEAVRSACDLPVVASMTFTAGDDQTRTMMGASPAELAGLAERHHADAVGVNCGVGPERAVALVRMLAERTSLPVWVKPNAGMPVLRDRQTVFPMGPEEFAAHVPALVEAGARFIGGCCGTGPEHVREVRARVRALEDAAPAPETR